VIRRPIFVASALALLMALAGPASAGNSFDSTVTIKYFGSTKRVSYFSGKVKSPRAACLDARKVTLYKQAKATTDPKKVGSFLTAGDGGWSVEATAVARFYFAKVKAAEIPAGTCKGDQSKKLEFN
jgi:hypothetical protein